MGYSPLCCRISILCPWPGHDHLTLGFIPHAASFLILPYSMGSFHQEHVFPCLRPPGVLRDTPCPSKCSALHKVAAGLNFTEKKHRSEINCCPLQGAACLW